MIRSSHYFPKKRFYKSVYSLFRMGLNLYDVTWYNVLCYRCALCLMWFYFHLDQPRQCFSMTSSEKFTRQTLRSSENFIPVQMHVSASSAFSMQMSPHIGKNMFHCWWISLNMAASLHKSHLSSRKSELSCWLRCYQKMPGPLDSNTDTCVDTTLTLTPHYLLHLCQVSNLSNFKSLFRHLILWVCFWFKDLSPFNYIRAWWSMTENNYPGVLPRWVIRLY